MLIAQCSHVEAIAFGLVCKSGRAEKAGGPDKESVQERAGSLP